MSFLGNIFKRKPDTLVEMAWLCPACKSIKTADQFAACDKCEGKPRVKYKSNKM